MVIIFNNYKYKCFNDDKLEVGFSLIELAVVLVIIGLLIAPLLTLANAFLGQRSMDGTRDNIAAVRRALAEYLAVNNRYPCPAPQVDLDAPYPYDAVCQIVTPNAVTAAAARGVFRRRTKTDAVLEGAVPYRQLNLPRERVFDAWGHLLTYAVTMSVTQPGVLNTTHGAIAVTDDRGASVITPPGAALWLVVSHGRDGFGGYTASSAPGEACRAGRLDTANCNHAGPYVVAPYAVADGRSHFDDVVDYLVWPELPENHDATFCTLPPASDGMPHLVQNNAIISTCGKVAGHEGTGCTFETCRNGTFLPIAVNLRDGAGEQVLPRQ